MSKLVKGSKIGKFGEAEKQLTLNMTSLWVALGITVLTWVGSELVPSFQEYGGILGSVAGLISMAVPVILAALRNNSDVTVEKK